jgi:pSer/pThr/pTyr-binding forkhead associated (FHA) protein
MIVFRPGKAVSGSTAQTFAREELDMFARVTLTVIDGTSEEGRKYFYESRAQVVVGRADDCDIQLYSEAARGQVSRHHCQLVIEPPTVRVRDLGSLNGTYINGELIGQRLRFQLPDEADRGEFGEHELKDGDVLWVGNVRVRIGIVALRHALQSANQSG